MSLGNYKLKQRDNTILRLAWLKPNKLITPDVSKDVKEQELSYIADGNGKQYTTLENNLVLSCKSKRSPTI